MAKTKETISILDAGLTAEGTLSFRGRLIIRGVFRGRLTGETVIIGEGGEVYADVKAGSVTAGGHVEGKIRAMHALTILPSGGCHGKVICRDLVVEPGGILNAEVTRLSNQMPDDLDAFLDEPDEGSSEEAGPVTGVSEDKGPDSSPEGG